MGKVACGQHTPVETRKQEPIKIPHGYPGWAGWTGQAAMLTAATHLELVFVLPVATSITGLARTSQQALEAVPVLIEDGQPAPTWD